MPRKRSTTAPRAWHACQECGRRLPNHPRTWKRQTCAGCVKRAQGKPVMRWNAATQTYSEGQP